MLRKFFQMVFLGDDHKSLHIYTAIIFSGSTECFENAEKYLSYSDGKDINPFFIDGSFSVKNNKSAAISHENYTDKLWLQPKCIEKVWGSCDECKTQDQIKENLKCIGVPEDKLDTQKTAAEQDYKPYFIHQDIKGYTHKTVVKKGVVNCKPKSPFSISPSAKNVKSALNSGMESLVWVKTSVRLSNSFSSNDFKYDILLDIPANVICFTPDFTLYFAPPVRYEVASDRATVKVGAGDKERNLVSFVANETTVNFEEWTRDEHIEEKSKCRVLISKIFSNPTALSQQKSLSVDFQIENVKSAGNRQFLLGIIVSAILTFGLDYTRLNEVKEWFPFTDYIPIDILWLLLVVPFLFTLLLNYPMYLGKFVRRLIKIVRWAGRISFVIWFLFMFVIFRIPTIPSNSVNALKITGFIFMGLSFFSNIIYTGICIYKRNYELLAMVKN